MLAPNHSLAGVLGLSPGSAGAWLLGIFPVVVAVRTVLAPLVVHSVRGAHARAQALP
ncbi:MAG: hypothetical protein ABIQ53_13665 [Terracoccus sp.]